MDMETIERAERELSGVAGLVSSIVVRDKDTGLRHTFTPRKQPESVDPQSIVSAGIAHGFDMVHQRNAISGDKNRIVKTVGGMDANSEAGRKASRATLILLGLLTEEPSERDETVATVGANGRTNNG